MLTKKQKFTKITVKASVIVITALLGTHAYAQAVEEPRPGVTIRDWINGNNSLNDGRNKIIAAANSASKDSMATNANLAGSAWAHSGKWFNFENTLAGATVKVSVTGVPNLIPREGEGNHALTPGFTVWASGAEPFNRGTSEYNGEVSSVTGWGVPHSFNVTGALNAGNTGTDWMAAGKGGNMIETLAYAVSNPNANVTSGAWGESIQSGWHDVSVSDNFESGITGSTTANMAELQFNNLAAGWYSIYVGGTDSSADGRSGGFNLVVSAVPEAETWAMLLAGLGLIGWRLRKQQPADDFNMTAA